MAVEKNDLLEASCMNSARDVASSERNTIEALASRKIHGFRRTIGDDGEYLDPIYQSNASLTKNVATDYHDRFLIELIQNAYDAHPVETRDGRIEIVLDLRSRPEGTLFVANTVPFSTVPGTRQATQASGPK